jgi:hypothetical protein
MSHDPATFEQQLRRIDPFLVILQYQDEHRHRSLAKDGSCAISICPSLIPLKARQFGCNEMYALKFTGKAMVMSKCPAKVVSLFHHLPNLFGHK